MSKKRKRDQIEEVASKATASESPSVQEVKEESKAPEPQRLSLRDAAERYISGFKEHHWPAIRRYADSLGVGEEATVDQCLEVFMGFGARLK